MQMKEEKEKLYHEKELDKKRQQPARLPQPTVTKNSIIFAI